MEDTVMIKKILIGVLIFFVCCGLLSMCDDSEEENTSTPQQTETAQSGTETTSAPEAKTTEAPTQTNNFKIGDEISFSSDDNQRSYVAKITDWGTKVEGFDLASYKTITWFEYEIKNTGDTDIELTENIFNIYADNHNISKTYSDKGIIREKISPGRELSGQIQGELDPDNYDKIEVQINDANVVIKDAEETSNAEVLQPKDVEFAECDSKQIKDFSGKYSDGTGGTLKVEMYEVPEETIVANMETKNTAGGNDYEGELNEIKPNVYQAICNAQGQVVVSFKRGSNNNILAYAYNDGNIFFEGKLIGK